MKRTWTKVGVGILATGGAVYLGLSLAMHFLVARKCTVYPVMTVASPTGKWQAEQVQQTCSDDPELKTVVWVSGTSASVGGRKWSAFRAVSSQPTGPSGIYEPVRLQLVWLNESELQISYPRGTVLQHGERTEEGFRVRYQESVPGPR